MLHFISFGSGSSGNCSFLYSEDGGLILDAGVGIRAIKRYAKAYGVPLHKAQAILVTHDHADHVRSVGTLSKDFSLPVYATEKVFGGIGRNWSVRQKIPAGNSHVFSAGETFTVGPFTVTTFPVPHDSAENVGYAIESEGITFVLMTDIGHLTKEMSAFIGRANYLVIEADFEKEMLLNGTYPEHLKTRILGPQGHQSNVETAEAIAAYATPKLRHVFLCHLSNENNHPDLALKTVSQILASHGIAAGNGSGADFQLDVLKRSNPSDIFNLV